MKRAALLLLGLPTACAPDALPENRAESRAAPNMTAVPIESAQDVAPAAPAAPLAQPPVPRGTSSSPTVANKVDEEGYRAIGTEPFWAVTVRNDELLLERPDRPPMRVAVAREVQARSIQYAGEGFTMSVMAGPCSDGMSDAIWSDRVQIAFGEGTLKGCGGSRDRAE